MKIAVLSGKGGAGKTFVSVNLACAAESTVYADCDVEEPNGHLFLKPVISAETPVMVTVPEADMKKCTQCRECIRFCRYNALALINGKLIIFKEVCHSCGGCTLFCPEKALFENQRGIGKIKEGLSDGVNVISGELNLGEVSGVPVVKQIIKKLMPDNMTVIDCPPGSACVVMESIKKADFCVLVAEPTPFGIHNLNIVCDLVKKFEKPYGVVLNKCMPGYKLSPKAFGEIDNVLVKIQFDEELARLNSDGVIAVKELSRYRVLFKNLLNEIKKRGKVCSQP